MRLSLKILLPNRTMESIQSYYGNKIIMLKQNTLTIPKEFVESFEKRNQHKSGDLVGFLMPDRNFEVLRIYDNPMIKGFENLEGFGIYPLVLQQGRRLFLPQEVTQRLNIKNSNAVILGEGNVFEIWNPLQFNEFKKQYLPHYKEDAEKFFVA